MQRTQQQRKALQLPTKPTPDQWQRSSDLQLRWYERRFGPIPSGLIKQVLSTREAEWRKMSGGRFQSEKLDNDCSLSVMGVIYALVFITDRKVYVGQTVNTAWYRFRSHVLASNASEREYKVYQAFQRTQFWRDVFVIPLQVVPMSGSQPQSHHTEDYIREFRRRALPLEQRWIRLLHADGPQGLNIQVDAPAERTAKRWQRRQATNQNFKENGNPAAKTPKNKAVPKVKAAANPPHAFKQFVAVDPDGTVRVSLEQGDHMRIRRSLHNLLQDQVEGKDPLDRVSQWEQSFRKDVVCFLSDQMGPQEVTGNSARVLLRFLSCAPRREKESNYILPIHEDVQKEKEEAMWIKVPWSRPEFKKFSLPGALHSKESKEKHPNPELLNQTHFSFRLNRPVGLTLTNYTKVIQDSASLDDLVLDPDDCPCKRYRVGKFLEFDGHVISTDPEALQEPSLQRLWLSGRKQRVVAHPQGLLEAVNTGLCEHIEQAAKRCKCPPADFDRWKRYLLSIVENHLMQFKDEEWIARGCLSKDGKEALKQLHESMVVAPVDKSQHDLMFACRSVYRAWLNKETTASRVYQPASEPDDVIWDQHAHFSAQLSRLPVRAHSYLYGAGKLHKEPVKMRWIAGAKTAIIDSHRNRDIMAPATSITPLGSALGGVLRLMMLTLEAKDIREYRPQGIKRYWVVTSVDPVAKQIKIHQQRLAKLAVWTRDFETMYTNLEHDRLVAGVRRVVTEAFEYQKRRLQAQHLPKLALKWDSQGKCTASFSADGTFAMAQVLEWVEIVVTSTFIKQDASSSTLHQRYGVPMGGKCSSELANLYCYAVESITIDQLLVEGHTDLVKSIYDTFRFIDDMLGFQPIPWDRFDYGMTHVKTNSAPHEAVFLGMKVNTSASSVRLSLQPKGAGWKWKPQRYIQWSSVHTKYTKNFLMKGLAVRAGVITNTMEGFQEAISYYSEGLAARGFHASALQTSWDSYLQEYWKGYPQLQTEFRQWFPELLRGLFGVSSAKRAAQSRTPARTQSHQPGMLLCGLHAINIILQSIGQDCVVRQELDQIADELAVNEALVLTNGDAQETLPHPKGYYHVSVLTKAAEIHAGLSCLPVTSSYKADPRAQAFLLGARNHWQAVVKLKGKWTLRDETTMEAVQNLTGFLRVAADHGMVLMLYKADGTADINNDAVSAPVPTLTSESKRTRAGASRNAPLAITESPFTPLREDVTTREPLDRDAKRHKAPEWQPVIIGQTTILSDPTSGRFRCPRPSCSYIMPNASSVIIHYTRHCVKQESASQEAAQLADVAPEVSVPGEAPMERDIIPVDDDDADII